MFLSRSNKLREQLVVALQQQGSLKAVDCARLPELGTYSQAAIYKELKELEEAEVICKVAGAIRLSVAWLLTLQRFCRTGVKRRTIQLLDGLTEDGQELSWQFQSIRATDRFWVDLTLTLLTYSENRVMYQWLPHPWHQLLHERLSGYFDSALRAINARIYIIVGGDTFLDNRFITGMPADIYQCCNSKGPFRIMNNTYVNVIQDFVIKTRYPNSFCSTVDSLFGKIKSLSDLKNSGAGEVFKNDIRIRVTVTRSPEEAASTRKLFHDYFGNHPG